MERKWIHHGFWTLAEQALTRLLDAATTLLLIRLFSAAHFGLFSIYQSWVALLLFLLPNLEVSLYRDFGKLTAQSGQLARRIGVFRRFNTLKLILTLALTVCIAIVPHGESFGIQLSLAIVAFLMPLAQAFYGIYREPLRFSFRQHWGTLLGALQRATVVGALAGITAAKISDATRVLSAACLLTFIYVVFYTVWAATWQRASGGRIAPAPSWSAAMAEGRELLSQSVFWLHLNGIILGSIQTLDILALGHFQTNFQETGRYAIAVKLANFFQIIPLALVNTFGVYLGTRTLAEPGDKHRNDELGHLAKISAIMLGLGLVCWTLGQMIAEPMLSFVGKGKLNADELARTTNYFYWQLLGVITVMLTYPLSSYLVARTRPIQLALGVHVPWFMWSASVYWIAAKHGFLATAKANILVYGFLVVSYPIYFIYDRHSTLGRAISKISVTRQ